jgi:hypothetical protein
MMIFKAVSDLLPAGISLGERKRPELGFLLASVALHS